MKRIAIFGSTGSIGVQTLSVCEAHPQIFSVEALVFGSNIEMGSRQITQFRPKRVGVFNRDAARAVKSRFSDIEVLTGDDVWSIAAADDIDIAVDGVSGFVGIFPLLAALDAGKTVALANKESIVCAGALVRRSIERGGGRILPVDSEQSAIFQCLSAGNRHDVTKLILTASGGAFRGFSADMLKNVTPVMAMKHPTWSMGKKITIDSATLFNKGLEVMEAAFLFNMKADDIEVLIHPQSIVHSMVEYADGAVMAQMGQPDMRLAIQYALTYPQRIESPVQRLRLDKCGELTFEKPDKNLFPALPLAYEAMAMGDAARVAYNSANEVAVRRFISGELTFLNIYDCVRYTIERMPVTAIQDVQTLVALDIEARRMAEEYNPQSSY